MNTECTEQTLWMCRLIRVSLFYIPDIKTVFFRSPYSDLEISALVSVDKGSLFDRSYRLKTSLLG